MLHSDIALPADENVRVFALQIGKKIKSKDYRAIAAVLEGHNASVGITTLHRCEDVLECDIWGNGVV